MLRFSSCLLCCLDFIQWPHSNVQCVSDYFSNIYITEIETVTLARNCSGRHSLGSIMKMFLMRFANTAENLDCLVCSINHACYDFTRVGLCSECKPSVHSTSVNISLKSHMKLDSHKNRTNLYTGLLTGTTTHLTMRVGTNVT